MYFTQQVYYVPGALRTFFNDATALSGLGPPRYPGFTITLRHTTFRTAPLDG